jgi:hypothetical protein
MKSLGILLLVLGIGGFIFSNTRVSGFESVEGKVKTFLSQDEKSHQAGWEAARWASLGVAVVGVVLLVAPESKG